VLHVPKLSINLLSMYQMKNSSTGKKFIFMPDPVDIYDVQTNSMVSISEVSHQSRIYTFYEFIEVEFSLFLIHVDESSRIWHERFMHLNFRFMQQISKDWLMVYETSIYTKESVGDVFLENTLKKNLIKERLRELPLL
jgi:hypothetical protein